MRFIATSDWHMKLWPDSEVTVDNIPKRLDELLSAVTQICNYARLNKIKLIVVAGDTNDKKHILDVKAFTRLKRVLESYPDLDFVFLHGNHDSTARIDYDSAVELLTNNQNISCVLNGPEVSEDINALYLPYSKEMSEQIDEAENINILIGHFGVNEAQLSNGHSIKTSISARDLSKFKLVLLGHYHKPQQLDNIWYMGSLIQLRRDETGEEKRFLVVDSETFEVQSVPITGYRKYFEFIIDEEYKDNPEMLNDTFKEIEGLKSKGNFVVVRNRLKDAPISLENSSSITIIDEVIEGDFQLRGISSTMDLSDQMKKYLEIEQIPEDEWEEYMTLGLSVMEAAKDVVYNTWVQDSSIGTDKKIITSTSSVQEGISNDEWAF